MRWIQTGRQLGQAVKNVQRLRQITGVFAKHGFVDIVDRMNLGRFLPSRLAAYAESQADKSIPERLRLAFEELGPTFVKLGQLLSTRPDLLPETYIEEFTKLQDNVQPLPFEIVKGVVEKELGRKLEDAYLSFSPQPLASASIGQVHEATIMAIAPKRAAPKGAPPEGTEAQPEIQSAPAPDQPPQPEVQKVVVKVQRPEIDRIIETDISLLAFLASLLEKYIPETRVIRPKIIVDEFFRSLSYELDFVVESNNMRKMAENLADHPNIAIPQVYKEWSTHKILTLERFEGIRVNDLAAIEKAGIDRKKLVEAGARAFFKCVMLDGLFHGDLHGGNLFVLPGDKLGIIDFGIVGRLSQRSRDQLANMLMAIISEDFENLCYHYAELGAVGPSIDFESFQREVRNNVSPYLGLSLGDVNVGQVLVESTRIATKYDIKVPGEWMLVFKAILTMEGMGRTLDPDFDLLALGQDLVKDLVKNQYSMERITKDVLWVGKDLAALLQVLPRQIRWMFRKFNSNDFAFEIKSPDLQDVRQQMDLNGKRISLSILTAGLFVASSLALQHSAEQHIGDYPLFSILFFALGTLLLIRLFLKR